MLGKDEVKHIAKLARLELTDTEIEKMQKDLSGILDYFNVLKRAPRANTEINAQSPAKNTLRKDEAVQKPASLANNLIAQAPDKKEGYIKVKSIL